VVKLDVTSEASVAAAFTATAQLLGDAKTGLV
jgi:hypothetical protein